MFMNNIYLVMYSGTIDAMESLVNDIGYHVNREDIEIVSRYTFKRSLNLKLLIRSNGF